MTNSTCFFHFEVLIGRFVRNTYLIVILFVISEMGMRIFFTPKYFNEDFYIKHTPNYSQGFDTTPLCYEQNGSYHLWRSEYYQPWPKSFSVNKSPNEFRVFVIGVSVSQGLAANKNYSYYLESILKSNKNKKIEVINLSHPGYVSTRTLNILRKCLKYQPDLIILDSLGGELQDEKAFDDLRKINKFPNGMFLRSNLVCLIKKTIDIIKKPKSEATIAMSSMGSYIMKTKGAYEKEGFDKIMEQYRLGRGRGELQAAANPENRKRWDEIFIKNMVSFQDILEAKNIPVMVVLSAYCPFQKEIYEDIFADKRALELFVGKFRENNTIVKSIFQDKKNAILFNKPEVLYKHLDLFPNKYAPFQDVMHNPPLVHLILAKELAKIINANYLKGSVPESLQDIPSLGEKYLDPEDKAHFLLFEQFHPDFILLYKVNHDKELLQAITHYATKNKSIVINQITNKEEKQTISFWLDTLNNWTISEGYVQDND